MDVVPLLEIIGESSIRRKHIYYYCSKCNSVNWMSEGLYKKGVGCSICNNKTIKVGYNDIATLRPDLIPYFKYKYDTIFNTINSHIKTSFICPICGYETEKWIYHVTKHGFRCPVCYGGFSFPSRYVAAILRSLNIQYITEKVFSWAKQYRYDFYIEQLNTIIEVNGGQHYKERQGWTPIETIQKSDANKIELARQNNIMHYHIIDARRSDVEFLKRNVISSGLLETLGVANNDIDWVKVLELVDEQTALRILGCWKSGVKNTQEIATVCNISDDTVRKYLKIYTDKGMCDYDSRKSILASQKLASAARRHPVECVNTGEVFDSIKSAAEKYGLARTSITQCLSGKNKSAGKDKDGNKLYWKYI